MVAYKDLVGREVGNAERSAVTALRRWAKASPFYEVPDTKLVADLRNFGATLPEAIAMLLCEDLGPQHAMIERISAIVMLLDEVERLERELSEIKPQRQNLREHVQVNREKRSCMALISRIEEHFAVSREDAYRERAERERSLTKTAS